MSEECFSIGVVSGSTLLAKLLNVWYCKYFMPKCILRTCACAPARAPGMGDTDILAYDYGEATISRLSRLLN